MFSNYYSGLRDEVSSAYSDAMDEIALDALSAPQPSITVTQTDTTDRKKKHHTANKIASSTKSFADHVMDGVEDIGEDMVDIGKDVYHGTVSVFDSVGSGLKTVGGGIEDVGESVWDGTKKAGSWTFHEVEKLGPAVINGAENVTDFAINPIGSLAKDLFGGGRTRSTGGFIHGVKTFTEDSLEVLLLGGGLLLIGGALWATYPENREKAYAAGKTVYQKGKKAAEYAALI